MGMDGGCVLVGEDDLVRNWAKMCTAVAEALGSFPDKEYRYIDPANLASLRRAVTTGEEALAALQGLFTFCATPALHRVGNTGVIVLPYGDNVPEDVHDVVCAIEDSVKGARSYRTWT